MRAPRTYYDLRDSISRRYADLPARLRQIAEFALHNPNDMAFATVATIAERAGVQPSSIIRFANSFGFPGFSDMQTLFQTRLVSGSPSYRERIAALRTARPPNSNTRSLLHLRKRLTIHQVLAGRVQIAVHADEIGLGQQRCQICHLDRH